MPPSASRSQASATSGVSSRAWQKWTESQTRCLRSTATSSGVIRCGRKLGMRVPMRRNSRCGMARSRPSSLSSTESAISSGSPPESRTSRTSVCSSQIGDRRLQAAADRIELPLAHQAAARAVAAVGRAGVERQEEHAVGVAVDQTLDDAGAVLAAGIGHVPAAHHELALLRHDLEADRAGGIVRIDQRREVRGDRDRKLLARQQKPSPFRLGQIEQALELIETGETMTHLPAPIVPVIGIIGLVEDRADLLAPGALDRNRGECRLLHLYAPPLNTGLIPRGRGEVVKPRHGKARRCMPTTHPDRSSGGKAPGGSVIMIG